MKKLLLATVATIALTAGSGWAAEPSAKDNPGAKAGAEVQGPAAAGKAQTTGAGAEMKSEADTKAGAEVKKSGKGIKAEADKKSDTVAKPGADKKSDMGVKGGAEKKGSASIKNKSETTGANADSDTKAGAKAKAGADMHSKSSATTTGSNASAAVTLTSEQKTKVRTTVIESGKAPKIERSQINFTLNVGTVVPRTVHYIAVPSMLVEIHPAWRGYRYFVVGDEIVIVDPRTLRIVAILAV
jgi:hypothetical protein